MYVYIQYLYIYIHTICFPLAAKKDIFLVGTMIKFLGLGIKTKIRLPRKGDPENLMEQWIEALGFLLQVSRVNSQIKKKKNRSSLKLKQPEISVQNEKAFERWFEPDSEFGGPFIAADQHPQKKWSQPKRIEPVKYNLLIPQGGYFCGKNSLFLSFREG